MEDEGKSESCTWHPSMEECRRMHSLSMAVELAKVAGRSEPDSVIEAAKKIAAYIGGTEIAPVGDGIEIEPVEGDYGDGGA